MSCNLTERVSLLIDGELAPDEAEQIASHIADCPICRTASKDFLILRRQIKGYEFTPDAEARRHALARILTPQPVPLWRRRLALPVPVFATLMLIMALFGWAVFPRLTAKPTPPGVPLADKRDDATTERAARRDFDLSRFDHGERAAIYTARRRPQP